jgi:hypothetical protein
MVQSDSSAELKQGFYGSAPVVRQGSASQAAVTVTATTALTAATISAANSAGVWGFSNSTVGKAYVARVKQMQVDIEALGVLLNKIREELVDVNLIKGGA